MKERDDCMEDNCSECVEDHCSECEDTCEECEECEQLEGECEETCGDCEVCRNLENCAKCRASIGLDSSFSALVSPFNIYFIITFILSFY